MKDRKPYKILTLCNLLCPFAINRLHLGNATVGRVITMDCFWFGAIADPFYMDKTFDEAMSKVGSSEQGGYFSFREQGLIDGAL